MRDLKRHHVTRWLDEKLSDASDNGKNGAVRALMGCLNWGAEEGHISANPIPRMKRPGYKPREVNLTDEQFETLLAAVKPADPFRDLLLILRETGCRPHEARTVEARHVRDRVWDFPPEESKGKKHRRFVVLNDAATLAGWPWHVAYLVTFASMFAVVAHRLLSRRLVK